MVGQVGQQNPREHFGIFFKHYIRYISFRIFTISFYTLSFCHQTCTKKSPVSWTRCCTKNSGPHPSSSTCNSLGGGDVFWLLTKQPPQQHESHQKKMRKQQGPATNRKTTEISNLAGDILAFLGQVLGRVLRNPARF